MTTAALVPRHRAAVGISGQAIVVDDTPGKTFSHSQFLPVARFLPYPLVTTGW